MKHFLTLIKARAIDKTLYFDTVFYSHSIKEVKEIATDFFSEMGFTDIELVKWEVKSNYLPIVTHVDIKWDYFTRYSNLEKRID